MEEYILRNNTTTLDRRVDAIIEEDERNKNFPVSFAIRKPINKIQVTGPTLDQKGEGACTAFSLTHALTSEKHRINIPRNIKLTEEYAVKKIYQEAQKIDEFPGGEYPGARPYQGGTSLVSGLRILKNRRLIKGYEQGYSLLDLILGVGYKGPAILVIPQYESMYEVKRKDEFVDVKGYEVGYHAIMVCAVDVVRKFFVLQNSQGTEYGYNGKCGITFDVMDKIFNKPFQIAFLNTK